MKLNFSHSGRQFFFITLVVAERREVLSRVVDERKIAFMAAKLREARAAANEAAISSLAMKRDPSAAHAFRRNCLEMNDIAKAICEAAM